MHRACGKAKQRISEETAETKNCFAIFGSEITYGTVRIMIIDTTRYCGFYKSVKCLVSCEH